MAWFVYLLRCCDGSLYTGITSDVTRRLKAHSNGQGARYTRGRLPVELVYTLEVTGQREALKEELRLKRLTRAQKLKLLEAS